MKSRIAMLVAAAALVAGTTTATAQTAAKASCPAPKAPPKELVKRDLASGEGRTIKFRSAIHVGYTGWLYDGCAADLKGAEFDSSKGRQTPFGFMVGAGKVIKGWDEGLIGMKEKGAKRLLVIPANMAYGDREVAGGRIPANSTLVFEVETMGIVFQPPEEEPAKK